jgi:hypothetical protein
MILSPIWGEMQNESALEPRFAEMSLSFRCIFARNIVQKLCHYSSAYGYTQPHNNTVAVAKGCILAPFSKEPDA